MKISVARCTCPYGYTLADDGVHCRDIDSAPRTQPDICLTCENTVGSYLCKCDEARCACPYGYTLADDGVHCRDIDECATQPDICPNACENTVGSYLCKCDEGGPIVTIKYRSNDGILKIRDAAMCYRRTDAPHDSKDACEDINECEEETDTCSPGVCINTDGDYACDCDPGWELSEDGHTCIDRRTATCYRSLVSGRCQPEPWPRTIASTHAPPSHLTKVQCCCTIGLAWGPECELCPAPGSPDRLELCSPKNIHPEGGSNGGYGEDGSSGGGGGSGSHGGGGLIPAGGGLIPGGGIYGDIDECVAMPDLCLPGRCINTIGSFRCVCPRGFKSVGATCTDVDECAVRPPPCDQLCRNTEGSYECLCRTGYELDEDGANCRDVDECEKGDHTCQQICSNTEGSYECSCQEGYEKRGDACVDQLFHNTEGSYECLCRTGYELDEDGANCRDVDECEKGDHTCQQICSNTEGSYECSCQEGYEKRGDACVEGSYECSCQEGYEKRGDACVGKLDQLFHNTEGSYECLCRTGYELDEDGANCRDVDECEKGDHTCQQICSNTEGSYECLCRTGYELDEDGANCRDVGECDKGDHTCQQICSNTEGSYECSCQEGYEKRGDACVDKDGVNCRDVDECEKGDHTCQQICSNTEGSYECSCQEGYEKRGDACVDVNECHEEGICPAPGKCVNLLGSYRCVCPRGFRLDLTGSRCLDRDECADGRCQSPCRNYAGSYRCDCPAGLVRSSSGICVPEDVCAMSPCGASPCFPVGGAYRCGCPAGYGWDARHEVCLQVSGGCAGAQCLFGCAQYGDSWQCGCPTGYNLVGAGHCLSAVDAGLPPGDIGDAPVFPVRDQYKLGGENELISTEGCFTVDAGLPPGDIGDAPVFPVRDQYKLGGENELKSTEGCFSCKVRVNSIAAVLLDTTSSELDIACHPWTLGYLQETLDAPDFPVRDQYKLGRENELISTEGCFSCKVCVNAWSCSMRRQLAVRLSHGYNLVGAGHCLSAVDAGLPPGDIGDAPVFPVRDQYKLGGENELISTEGCFSCKVCINASLAVPLDTTSSEPDIAYQLWTLGFHLETLETRRCSQ
ncbi:calcium-binding EGF domain-containing protein [Phthorimaea operculella]|nr:calcium-binding EGF domain-containing protein [Phthorimaea operculella]